MHLYNLFQAFFSFQDLSDDQPLISIVWLFDMFIWLLHLNFSGLFFIGNHPFDAKTQDLKLTSEALRSQNRRRGPT